MKTPARYVYILSFLSFVGSAIFSSPASADKPTDWQIDFQDPVTPVMERVVALHDIILWVQVAICLLVGALLFFIIFKFRASRNPTPSKTTHNATLEVVWTLIPVVILLVIAFPSLRLLYYMDVTPEADMTVKAVGNQWYWTYEYPDEDISFDSMMVEDDDLKPGQLRLFEVDKRVVVPVNTTVRLITTSNDVLHSWAVPAFGVKKDSVPGRLNETWFRVEKEGVYYGQCSELCGVKHGFMPIVVEVVSPARYKHWVTQLKPKDDPKPETLPDVIVQTPDSESEGKTVTGGGEQKTTPDTQLVQEGVSNEKSPKTSQPEKGQATSEVVGNTQEHEIKEKPVSPPVHDNTKSDTEPKKNEGQDNDNS